MITSLQNERVRRVRALQSQRDARREAGRFVIEGPKLIQEAIGAHSPLLEIFYTEPFASTTDGLTLLAQLKGRAASLASVSEPVMKSMSDTLKPQGVLAVAPVPEISLPRHPSFALILDAIGDPGNVGSILRVAAGAAVEAVAVMPETVDVYSPKVVRGAMGAHFRLSLCRMEWDALSAWLAEQTVFLADSRGGTAYYDADWTQPCALIVSSEAHGANPEARRMATIPVTIPMPGGIESLNVAMASGILIYEMLRQRASRGEASR